MFQSANNAAVQAGCLDSTGVIIAPHVGGEIIKVSKGDKANGSIMLTETATFMNRRGYLDEAKKVAFMRGPVTMLQRMATLYAGKVLPGRLCVQEFLEGTPEVQERIADDLKYFDGDYDKALGKKVKTNPKTGAFLTASGKRIIRFVDYDMSGTSQDILIQHDRVASTSTSVAPVTPVASAAPEDLAELPEGDELIF